MESLASNAPRVPLVYAVTRRRPPARMLVGYLLWRAATALSAATVAALGLLTLAAAHAGIVPPALAAAAWVGDARGAREHEHGVMANTAGLERGRKCYFRDILA